MARSPPLLYEVYLHAEHEEEERRAYERVLEVVEAQRVMDQHLDEIKNKMREAKERRDAAAAQAKAAVLAGGAARL